MVALLVGRKRINRLMGRAVLALSFTATTAYWLWRLGWFEDWRFGTPPAGAFIGYACYLAAYGVIGWFIASKILSGCSMPWRKESRKIRTL